MNLEIPREALLINQPSEDDKVEETCFLRARDHKLPVFTRYREGVWREPFFFVQIADLKLGEASPPEENGQEELGLLKAALDHISRMQPKPRFVIFTGNVTSLAPGDKSYSAQVRDFKETVLKALLHNAIPVVCVSGKHDTGVPQTRSSLEKYHELFGDDWFVFWVEAVQFICINSTYYEQGDEMSELKKEQDDWLESQLFEAQFGAPKHVVLFQSVPWFHSSVGEDNDGMNIPLEDRTGVVQKLKDAGVSVVFAGSLKNSQAAHESLQIITTGPLSTKGEDSAGVRLVKILPSRIESEFYELKDIPDKIVLSS